MIEKGQAEIDYRCANPRDSIRATLAAMKATAERA
jgi:hypothetical protein